MSASDSGAERRVDSVHPSAPDETYETWVGRVIDDRYRIDGLLGEGGMGAVFEAEQLKLKKQVALKVIHPEFAGDGEVAKRFVREAMASAQLEHPHVASATDYGTLEEGGAYLVMRLVRGGSLRDALDEEEKLEWVRACQIGAQIADALAAAHKATIVHRDLKPDNVMLEPRDDGRPHVLVLDFGIARVADDKITNSGQALTRVGTVIGTPGYMAPEQALGEPVDFRVDLYSLGLLLHEMITGKRLFDVDDLTAIVTRQLTEEAPRLSALGAEIPEPLDDLVASLLEKDKDGRPQSAAEVRELLQKLVLSAQLQRVTSGEHSLPDVGNVTGPFPHADPQEAASTPPGLEPSAAASKQPKQAMAPTMMAKGPAPTPSPLGRKADPLADLIARARTLPMPLLAGAAAALGLFGLLFVFGVASLLSDDEIDEEMRKREMVAETIAPSEEPEEAPGILADPEPEPEPEPRRTIPTALQQEYADMMLSERRRVRRRAARTILDHEPQSELPEFVIAVAGIESTTRCAQRRDHVVRLGELGDIRALPVLERLDATPRNQCGNFIRRTDCLRCLRDELAVALSELRPE